MYFDILLRNGLWVKEILNQRILDLYDDWGGGSNTTKENGKGWAQSLENVSNRIIF
jgi:hypothetical protein